MINEFRVRGLRSFSDSVDNEFIPLKPITVLVGKNSSGKSTFIRSFPLLRQSLEAKTVGPILWYGNYVDFGQFSEAINSNGGVGDIYFDFNMKLSIVYRDQYNPFWDLEDYKKDNAFDLRVSLGVSDSKKGTFLSSLYLELCGIKYKLKLDGEYSGELFISSEGVWEPLEKVQYITREGFIPDIGAIKTITRTVEGVKEKFRSWDGEFLKDDNIGKALLILSKYFYRSTSEENIKQGLLRVKVINKSEILKRLKRIFFDQKYFLKKIESISDSEVDELYYYIMNANLNSVLYSINSYFERYFRRVRYIAPLRSTAERYYRHQDVQVNEIDHTGSNLAMLLNSWKDDEISGFSDWTKESFGFSVRTEMSGLHYALKIKNKNDSKEYNINDMGFGFSQLLPIIVSLWQETIKNKIDKRGSWKRVNKKYPLTFVIEQPELHLHPSFQRKLVDVFVKTLKVAKDVDSGLKIIFETHSQSMLEALGESVFNGDVSSEDLSIVIVDKNEQGDSQIKFSGYDSEGDLVDWPIGFFSGDI